MNNILKISSLYLFQGPKHLGWYNVSLPPPPPPVAYKATSRLALKGLIIKRVKTQSNTQTNYFLGSEILRTSVSVLSQSRGILVD